MHIPHISSGRTAAGFEACCAIRVASLLLSDLLKDSHYGVAEGSDSRSFSKLNARHLQNSREQLLAALTPLEMATFEVRIAVLPDLLHKAQGEIDVHFIIRCGGESDALARERVAETFLALMPVLAALVPEADLKLVLDDTSLKKCLEPFPLKHAAAVVRRRQDVRIAADVSGNGVGFLPIKGESGKLDNEVVAHILPWMPTHDDWGRLLDAMIGQLNPHLLLVRLAPRADVTQERGRVLEIIELCEAVLAGLDPDDLALRNQVMLLAEQANKRLEYLNSPCFDVAPLLVSSCPVSQPLIRIVGAGISGNRLGGEEPAWLQGGYDVRPVDGEPFMERTFFPDNDAPFSLGEAACAFRLPSPPSRDIPGLPVQRFRANLAMLPPELDDSAESIRLFINEYQGMRQPVQMDPDDRMRHIAIFGQTGTGKSSLLESLIVQDVRAGRGVAVIDPHGDLIDAVMTRIPAERAEDVIVFDMLDRERPLGFNMLSWSTIHERDLIIDELYRTLDHIYDMKQTGGPIFEQHFRNMMKLLMGDGPREGFTPTLLEFIRCYTSREFRNWLQESIRDQQVLDFIQEAEDAGGDARMANVAPYITSKFSRFVNDTTLKNIVGQEETTLDFDSILADGKICLIKLGKGRFGSQVSALLANMLVARFKFAAMKRGDMPMNQRRDYFLFVDEANNLPRDNFAELLSEARKYRLGLVLATQYCSQLGSVNGSQDDLLSAVLGNVGSLIAFRTGTQDAEMLAKGFAPYFSSLDIMSLPNYYGYARINLKGQSTTPFSFRTELITTPGNGVLAERIRTLSRLRYGRDVRIVEAMIYRRSTCWKIEPAGKVKTEQLMPSVVNLVALDLNYLALDLPVAIDRLLTKAGLETVGDIVRVSTTRLVEEFGFSVEQVMTLNTRLEKLGCCLPPGEAFGQRPAELSTGSDEDQFHWDFYVDDDLASEER